MTVADWAGTLVDWKAELEALKQQYCAGIGSGRDAPSRPGPLSMGCSRRRSARRAGCWRKRRAWRGPTGSSRCSAAAGGRPRLCAIGCAAMWPRRSATPTASWVVDETGFLKKGGAVGRRRPAVFRDGRAGRELPGRGVRQLRQPLRPCAGRPPAPICRSPGPRMRDRRRKAAVPEDCAFATKPAISAGDDRPVPGCRPALRLGAGRCPLWRGHGAAVGCSRNGASPYVLAVRSNHTLQFLEQDWQLVQTDPATVAAELEGPATGRR